MDLKVNVHSIETMGALDGPGLRTVFFLEGCPSRCIYCHNPDTWSGDEGTPYAGEELLAIAKRYRPYYGKEGGVTFSGGEPLIHGVFLSKCMDLFKCNGINVVIDTSGTYSDEYSLEVLKKAKLVILDIKHTDPEIFHMITGRDMEQLYTMIDIVNRSGALVWIRQVIVPGLNDTAENVLALKEFVKKIKNVEKIELLGYHDLAKEKWQRLGLNNQLKNTSPMDGEALERLNQLLT